MDCPAGKQALGGGGSTMSLGMQLVTSAPTDAGDGWVVMYQNGYTSARDVFAWVICANVGVA